MAIDVEGVLAGILERSYDLAMETAVPEADAGSVPTVVGYFPLYFPEEIAHAAGLLPHALLGGGNRLEVRYADARIGSFVCSICRGTAELGLSGAVAGLRGFFASPICDPAKHMVGIWGRNLPAQPAQLLSLPQNANSPAAPRYVYDEFQRLRAVLAERIGHEISDAAIRASIATYNENRRLQRALYAIKRDDPARLSSVEAYLLIRAGTRLRREDHNALLREALEAIAARQARPLDKPRVVFLGGFCEQPPIEMIEAIEDACFIVDDDLLLGQRWIIEDVPETGDPVWALAESYLERSAWSPVQYDARKPKEDMLLRMMRAARAEAAILTAAKFCEPGLDDQLALSRRLEREHVPYLLLEFEDKMTSFEQLAMQVETFAESLLFG